jgi:hypothetical protein
MAFFMSSPTGMGVDKVHGGTGDKTEVMFLGVLLGVFISNISFGKSVWNVALKSALLCLSGNEHLRMRCHGEQATTASALNSAL